jgi:hypothetical protein
VLSFRNLLLPAFVTDRSHVEEFVPNGGDLVVGAWMPRTVRRQPVAGFCLGIDDFLPVPRSVHHCSDLLKQIDSKSFKPDADHSNGSRQRASKIRCDDCGRSIVAPRSTCLLNDHGTSYLLAFDPPYQP